MPDGQLGNGGSMTDSGRPGERYIVAASDQRVRGRVLHVRGDQWRCGLLLGRQRAGADSAMARVGKNLVSAMPVLVSGF